jgi:hypothetical protein
VKAFRRLERAVLLVTLFLCIGMAAACTSSGSHVPSPSPSALSRSGHVWWGIGGGDVLGFLPHLEQVVGRPFAVVRKYSLWDSTIPGKITRETAANGAIPYVSWEVYRKDGTALTFADVANGSQDAWIHQQAQSIRDSGIRMFFTFMHEPEFGQGQGAKPQAGPPAQYVQAFDRVHRIFAQEHVANVVWVANLGERTFRGENGGADAWMPPPADYAYVGVDGYLKWPCEPQLGERSFAQIFGPAEEFARAAGKPLFIGEVGVQEFTACGNSAGTPNDKADWITAAAATMKRWPNVRAVCWTYGTNYKVKNDVTLVWNEDSSPQALAAFRKAGLDPYFGRTGWP